MYCVKCGRQLPGEANYCRYCGTKTFCPETAESPDIPYETQESHVQQTEIPPAVPVVPVTEAPQESRMSLTALVCGILAVSLFWIVLPGIALGLVALIYGVRSTVKYPEIQKGQAIAGLILGITAIALSAFVITQFWGSSGIISGLSKTNLSHL
jgi:hypothetical protein